MEKFYLEGPSLERKEEAFEYLDEHAKYNSPCNGTGGMHKILNNQNGYEEWLEELKKKEEKEYAYSIGKVPSKTYFLIRESDNKIIGMISIRHDINVDLLSCGGHIGYGIRPTERGKGYNKINLYLGLEKAKELNLEHVMLDCDIKNIASDKTIQALGGILDSTVEDPYDGELTNVYWIDVNKSLEDYKDTYEKYIKREFVR